MSQVNFENICASNDVASCVAVHALHAAEIGIAVAIISTVALVYTVYLGIRATNAATKATEISQITLEHLKKSAALTNRPYVMQAGFDIEFLYDLTETVLEGNGFHSIKFMLYMENVGSTIANDCIGQLNYQIFDVGGFPEDFQFPDFGPIGFVDVRFPGRKTYKAFVIAKEDLHKLYVGEKELHVWGWENYAGGNDVSLYRTEFHYRLLCNSNPLYRPASFRLETADNFNATDEKCFHPKRSFARTLH